MNPDDLVRIPGLADPEEERITLQTELEDIRAETARVQAETARLSAPLPWSQCIALSSGGAAVGLVIPPQKILSAAAGAGATTIATKAAAGWLP